MVDEDAADGAARAQPPDPRYYGPFGPPPDAFRAADAPLTGPGPEYAPHPTAWPAPDGAAPVLTRARCLPPVPGRPPRRGLRAGPVIAIAAAVALLIGGGAGYGGARLAQRAEPPAPVTAGPTQAADPTPTPTPTPTATQESVPPAPSTLDTVAVAKRTLPGTVMIQVGRGNRIRLRARHPGPHRDQQPRRGRRRRRIDHPGDLRRRSATQGLAAGRAARRTTWP